MIDALDTAARREGSDASDGGRAGRGGRIEQRPAPGRGQDAQGRGTVLSGAIR
jgi:hypothetical protein